MPLLFKYFIITSNQAIDELFREQPNSIEPIERRCQIVHMLKGGPIPNLSFDNLDVDG